MQAWNWIVHGYWLNLSLVGVQASSVTLGILPKEPLASERQMEWTNAWICVYITL